MLTDSLKQDLINRAEEVTKKSYSPYSNFSVGAALVTEAGNVFIGTNVEIISYGLTICAERSAIVAAIAHEGPGMRIKAIAVTSGNKLPELTPCGACRQVITEFGQEGSVIYYGSDTSGKVDYTTMPIRNLLPGAFHEFVASDGSVKRIQSGT